MKIKNFKLAKDWVQFQRNLIPPPKCQGCNVECIVLYDAHHDQYFSGNCGLVIMEMGVYCVPYLGEFDEE